MSRLFQLFAVFTLTFSSSTAYSNSVVLDGGKYNASWYYDEASDSLNFTVVVETTGWVGFGFSDNAPTGMVGYDVAVAGVQGGNGYIVVRYFRPFFFSPPGIKNPSRPKSTFSQPLKEEGISELVRIGSIIIFHLSELWKAKFSILCDAIFLVRL